MQGSETVEGSEAREAPGETKGLRAVRRTFRAVDRPLARALPDEGTRVGIEMEGNTHFDRVNTTRFYMARCQTLETTGQHSGVHDRYRAVMRATRSLYLERVSPHPLVNSHPAPPLPDRKNDRTAPARSSARSR